MKVFVLLENGQMSPVCVVSDPNKIHDGNEGMPSGYGDGYLPTDAYALKLNRKLMSEHFHREIVGEWFSPKTSTLYKLICYDVV